MDNKITVVVGSDGRILKIEQDGVFRRSNKQNELVALLLYPTAKTVKVNFLRPDGVKPKSQYMSYVGQEEYEGTMYFSYSYILSDFQLYATGPLVVSLDIIDGNVVSTTGDFTIDVEASEGQYDDEAPTDVNQYNEAIKSLMQTDRELIDRTENVPYLVASIQKVASNAFTYTNNSNVVSAPIVIGGGEDAPIPVNAASTIEIPKEAWGQHTDGYEYVLTAAMHGQMRDGAKPNDLWVSFDETENSKLQGVYADYSVAANGDITIVVNSPIDMTVRVWNGKGLVDEVARENVVKEEERATAAEAQLQQNIDAETQRAESAEKAIRSDLVGMINAETQRAKTEENNLQAQIDHIEQSGVDLTARAEIAQEVERATAAEKQEEQRATQAERDLQAQITTNVSDIQGLREDITNESHFRGMFNSVEELRAAYPTATPHDYAWIAGGNIWIWQDDAWTDSEKPVPSTAVPASNATPLMDGTASVGVANSYARGDHRHPSDSAKLNKAGDTMTGPLILGNNLSGTQSVGVVITEAGEVFDRGNRVYSAGNPAPVYLHTFVVRCRHASGLSATVKFRWYNSIKESANWTEFMNWYGVTAIMEPTFTSIENGRLLFSLKQAINDSITFNVIYGRTDIAGLSSGSMSFYLVDYEDLVTQNIVL